MTAPSKSKVKMIADDIRRYLDELERDYKLAHDMAHEPAGRGLEWTSGGDVSNPTADTAVAHEQLKSHLRGVGFRLEAIRAQTLEVRNNLEDALVGADSPRLKPVQNAVFPRVITKAERQAVHLARERKLGSTG